MNLQEIQTALKEADIDGWLFYDFHNQDHLSYRVLGLDFGKFSTRRWFYYIPANGEPTRLSHTVEPTKLDSLPGSQRYYLAYGQLHKELENILGSPKNVAMQYSPLNNIPLSFIAASDAIGSRKPHLEGILKGRDALRRSRRWYHLTNLG